MRGIIAGGWLMFLALTARAGDAPGLEIAPDGGFVPRGGSIRVAFRFAELVAVPETVPPAPRVLEGFGEFLRAGEWKNGQGATASVDLCLVNHQAVLSQEVLAVARLRLTNISAKSFIITLAVTLVPEKAIHALAFEKQSFSIAGRTVLVADTPARGAILADSPFAPRGLTPQERAHVESAQGECRGEMNYDLTLAPGKTQTLGFICPLSSLDAGDPGPDFYRALAVEDLFTEAEKQRPSR